MISKFVLNKKKYTLLTSLLFLLILLCVVFSIRPLNISSDKSPIEQIPIIFWILIPLISLYLVISSIWVKSALVQIINSLILFFSFYSFNLFFKIIPTQTDIGSTRLFNYYFEKYDWIDPNAFHYFEFPIFFTFIKSLKELFILDIFQYNNIGFILLISLLPLFLMLAIHKEIIYNISIFFITPALYLIMIYYFFNDQLVPQFFGLIFLIITIGLFVKYRTIIDNRFLYLSIISYIICIYTHPFMFVFFLIGIFFYKSLYVNKYFNYIHIIVNLMKNEESLLSLILKSIKSYKKNLFVIYIWLKNKINLFILKLKCERPFKNISFTLLIIIYLIIYKTRLTQMNRHFDRLLYIDRRGGSWVLLSYIFGEEEVGLEEFKTYPLSYLVPPLMHDLTRWISIMLLLIIFTIIIISIINSKKKNILLFDIITSFGSIVFLIVGFLFPYLLGQRTFQATFINITKYHKMPDKYKTISIILLIIIISISPIIYNLNTIINETEKGTLFYEDIGTLNSGIFIEDNIKDEQRILYPDRRLFPLSTHEYLNITNFEGNVPQNILQDRDLIYNMDLISDSPKMRNRMEYYGVKKELEDLNSSIVYDIGRTKIVVP